MAECARITARRDVAAVSGTWQRTLFHQAPEQFRVVETMEGELPFPLPRDPAGYNHHAVDWRGARYFVTAYPQGDRMILTTSGAMWVMVIEQRGGRGGPKPIRGFFQRKADKPPRPEVIAEVRRLLAARGPLPCDRKVASALAERLEVPLKTAEGLLSGDLLWARVTDGEAGVDWERVVEVIGGAFALDPKAWWSKARSAAVIDAIADRWRKSRALERRMSEALEGKLGGLSRKPAKALNVPATGRLSPRARRWLAAELGFRGRKAANPADLAAAVQQVRYDQGVDDFGKLLAKLGRALGDEAPEAFDFIYQHVEHSH
jgi:hypothetical protein